MTSSARTYTAYWLLVAFLFLAQAAYTVAGLHRLWYEELAEGIRNPFWLDHRLVYDGVSSNVGWYGLVLLVYKAFGFSTYAAKYVRLGLHVLFLVSTAILLKRCLGIRRAWVPLVAVGLSPTLLYFNNLGTSYALDVELCPLLLLLIVQIGERAVGGHGGLAVRQFAIGCLAMLACLIFPAFLFYLPVLFALYVTTTYRSLTPKQSLKGVGWLAAGFVAPFGASLLYLRNVRAFLADPAVGSAGVFRGGGSALTFDSYDIFSAAAHVLGDLFVTGNTYYFALPHVEFSGRIGHAAASGIVLATFVAWKWTPSRQPLVLAGILCVLSIAATSLTRNLPGLRRSTGFITGAYVAVACAWAMPTAGTGWSRVADWAAKLVCLVLIAHHLVVYLPNYRYLVGETRRAENPWFYRFGSPDESVRRWAHDWVLQGKPLNCQLLTACRYSEIYAAVAGYLRWNGPGDVPVLATDPESGATIELNPRSWQTHASPP